MNVRDKKRGERWLIEEARRRSDFFPSGELTPFESPDWLIADASLGIEVSDLLRPKGGNLFSGAQLSSFQAEVVAKARRQYFTEYPNEADVLVFFKNEWNRKRDLGSYASSLARFVHANIPSDKDCVTLSERHADSWVEGVSVIRISRTGDKWQAGGIADGQPLGYSDLATRIAAKNKLLGQYQQRLPGWKMWLLLTTEIRVLHSVWIPSDISGWTFTFDFDRVLLMPWDHNVIDLARNNREPRSL
jgi:hypothetical protein